MAGASAKRELGVLQLLTGPAVTRIYSNVRAAWGAPEPAAALTRASPQAIDFTCNRALSRASMVSFVAPWIRWEHLQMVQFRERC